MKYIFTILIFACYVSVNAQPAKKAVIQKSDSVQSIDTTGIQNAGIDSVNIRQMVEDQIAAARTKQSTDKTKALLQVNNATVKKNAPAEENSLTSIRNMIPLSDDALIKASVLTIFSLFVFGIVFIRRFRFHGKKKSNKKNDMEGLKKNISILREEKPVVLKKANKMKSLRARLASSGMSLKLTNEAISKKAKELQISKGEILLAARINSHEMVKACTTKK